MNETKLINGSALSLTLHVCRFREEESTHAASRRERPQNAPRHRGRPSPWAQGRDGYVLTIFRTSNPSNSCPVSGALQQCVCIYTAVYSQTLTALSIYK